MFDWADYLTLAERLASSSDEASQRSAISRAYYAAFHAAARYVARTKPEVEIPRDGRKHQVVWTALKDGTRQERGAKAWGIKLRGKRTQADYELVGLSFPRDAAFALEAARGVVDNLRAAQPAGGTAPP